MTIRYERKGAVFVVENYICEREIDILPSFLVSHPHIRTIKLSKVTVTAPGLCLLFKYIPEYKRIKVLIFEQCVIHDKTWSADVPMTNTGGIEVLEFEDCNPTNPFTHLLFRVLPHVKKIEVDCCFSTFYVKLLTNDLWRFEVEYWDEDFQDYFRTMIRTLPENYIHEIYWTSSPLQIETLCEIYHTIRRCRTRSMNLSHCNFSDRELTRIVQLLKQHFPPSLLHVYFKGNNITNRSFKLLLDTISQTPNNIRTIGAELNQYLDDCFTDVIQALKKSVSLRSIKVNGSLLPDNKVQKIHELCEHINSSKFNLIITLLSSKNKRLGYKSHINMLPHELFRSIFHLLN